MVIIEAMAHGLSALAANACGASCCIQNGISGYVFRSGDAGDSADKIEKILSAENAAQMGLAAFRNVAQNYSFEAYYRALSKILTDEFDITLS